MRRTLSAIMAVLVLSSSLLIPVAMGSGVWHTTYAAGTTTLAPAWNYFVDTITIEPASADVIVTFNPSGTDTDGVVVPVGGFTFTNIPGGVYNVSIARANSTAVEVWAW